jgi:hypothetical protein
MMSVGVVLCDAFRFSQRRASGAEDIQHHPGIGGEEEQQQWWQLRIRFCPEYVRCAIIMLFESLHFIRLHTLHSICT